MKDIIVEMPLITFIVGIVAIIALSYFVGYENGKHLNSNNGK